MTTMPDRLVAAKTHTIYAASISPGWSAPPGWHSAPAQGVVRGLGRSGQHQFPIVQVHLVQELPAAGTGVQGDPVVHRPDEVARLAAPFAERQRLAVPAG